MNTQPEALRLADWLFDNVQHINHAEAAAELRRLHAMNNELLEALVLAWPIIEHERFKQDGSYGSNFAQHKADRARQAHAKARAAIAKATGETDDAASL